MRTSCSCHLVLSRIRVIRFAHADVNHMTERAEPAEVVAALHAIAQAAHQCPAFKVVAPVVLV